MVGEARLKIEGQGQWSGLLSDLDRLIKVVAVTASSAVIYSLATNHVGDLQPTNTLEDRASSDSHIHGNCVPCAWELAWQLIVEQPELSTQITLPLESNPFISLGAD